MHVFKAQQLPYDMGNAGDLIKHGLLAEYTQWWCTHYSDMVFIDPFGGRPWQEPINATISERVLKLGDHALSRAQKAPGSRYYGSGFVVKHAAFDKGCQSVVLISDRNETARGDLIAVGLEQFEDKSFDKENAFTILDCQLHVLKASLVLLDPFADFIDKADKEFPKIASFIDRTNIPVVLYLLSNEKTVKQYSQLREKYFKYQFNQLSMHCPKLLNTSVKGESKYTSEILLLIPKNRFTDRIDELKDRLSQFSTDLSQVLETNIIFNDEK